MKSKFAKLSIKDGAKGLVIAFISAILTGLMQALNTGSIPHTLDQWTTIGTVAATSTGSYLIKNYLSNSKDEFFIKEEKVK